MMHLRSPTPELFEGRVQQIQDWITQIADGADPQSIVDQLESGVFEMWLPFDGERWVGLVIVQVHKPRKCLEFLGAGGDVMGNWEGLHSCFVDLAKARDCTSYEFRGRRGFLRTFKKYGMKEKYTIMTCNFTEAV